jgi:hypothetical protein
MMCGEMQLDINLMYGYTAKEFFNYRTGYLKSREADFKLQMSNMRKLYHATLMPHLKKQIPEIELMPFPWDHDMEEKIKIKDIKQVLDEVEQAKAFWRKQEGKA